MSAPLIRVLVVDDSAYNRRVLTGMLEKSPRLQVVGTAGSGEDALKKLYEYKPDLITLDLEMPGMDGFTFLRLVMESKPLPIIVVSSRTEDKAIFRALELGAADFIAKPTARISSAIARIESELLYKAENAAAIQMQNMLRIETGRLRETPPKPAARAKKGVLAPSCVAIGSSTGGPAALHFVLGNLDPEYSAPIVIAQHMPAGYTKPFAERLGRRSKRDVWEASDGELLTEGAVLVAPGGSNLFLETGPQGIVARVEAPSGEDRFVPSVDRLFSSAARVFGSRLHAVVLTGMGNDGLEGSAAVRKQGGRVLAESAETAIVYGMPREVVEHGLADVVLPLSAIPQYLSQARPQGALGRRTRGEKA